MTVKELLQQLQTFPQDAFVVTEGYEEGFDAIKKVSMIRVEENTTKEHKKIFFHHRTRRTQRNTVHHEGLEGHEDNT